MSLMPRPRYRYKHPLPIVSSLSLYRDLVALTPDLTSRAWALENQVVYIPLYNESAPYLAYGGWYNGSVISGTLQFGIYAPDDFGRPGTAIYRSGYIAQAGVSALQQVGGSGDPILAPQGLFYIALVFDNTTSTVIAQTNGGLTNRHTYMGCVFHEDGAVTLPLVANPDTSVLTSLIVPVVDIQAV